MSHMRWSLAALVAALAGALAACTAPVPVPVGHRPVVLVHGYAIGPGSMQAARARLVLDGYADSQIVTVDYQAHQDDSVTEIDDILADAVDRVLARTGAHRVDVLSHSLGSLVTKQCIIAGRCAGKVAHWMSVAGVDNGTTVELGTPGSRSGDDVHGRSPVRANLDAHWCDLVHQGVQVEVQWTRTDGIVDPPTNSREPPPAVDREVTSLGVNHLTIIAHPAVVDETARFFAS